MKATINSKRYNTANCETLGEIDHYNNGNYSGTTYLLRANDGQLLVHTDSNGQDLHIQSNLESWEDSMMEIDAFKLDDDQEKRCVELGLIEIV